MRSSAAMRASRHSVAARLSSCARSLTRSPGSVVAWREAVSAADGGRWRRRGHGDLVRAGMWAEVAEGKRRRGQFRAAR